MSDGPKCFDPLFSEPNEEISDLWPFNAQACPARYPEHGESPAHDWEPCAETQGDPASGFARTVRYRVCRLCGEED